jgi:hypothetical protein
MSIKNTVCLFVIILTSLLTGCSTDRSSAPLDLPGIPFDKNENWSANYEEVIRFYRALAEYSPDVTIREIGPTDLGLPLHEVVITKGSGDPDGVKADNKVVVMINNGIHPGEPCGIDASMLLARKLIQEANRSNLLDEVAVVILPVYNVGGALNRGPHSRANQNGPEMYGFRGNAKNLDLNRDFIKCDSRNAQTFVRWFTDWSPDLFVDTHTSNGADYQYVMTLIESQKDKMNPRLASFMTSKVTPELYRAMDKAGYPMTPYVYSRGNPESGIYGFLDLPRYSTGLGALHHTIGYTTEAHMLKSFSQRVKATLAFFESLLAIGADQKKALQAARKNAYLTDMKLDSMALSWRIDMNSSDTLFFEGYEAGSKVSEVSGLDRLYYDTTMPYERKVPYWPVYKAERTIDVPKAYILPQGYSEVAERLRWNGVEMSSLQNDTTIEVSVYYIESFKDRGGPYEGHYLHQEVVTRTEQQRWKFYAGDWWIPTEQEAMRFLINTLEPEAPDSYFAWNFFDGILMQKEYFSDYVYEDLAAQHLRKFPELKQQLEMKRLTEPGFREDARAHLDFIYRQSPNFEKTYRRYPVARVE